MKKRRQRKARQRKASSSEQRRMLYRQLFIGFVLLLLLGGLLTAVWHVTRMDRFQITDIAVSGGKTIAHDEIERRVDKELEGSYYRLIPYRFAPLYPQERIARTLATLPRIKTVGVERDGWHTIEVNFVEYEPAALWCGEAVNKACAFLDDSGFAFSTAPALDGSALVRYRIDGQSVETEATPLPVGTYRATRQFIDELQNRLGLKVAEVFVNDDIDVTYRLTTDAELKVSNRLSVQESITNLKTIFSNTAYDHLAEGDFNYIDLRFGDKVFVSEEEVVASSTATSSIGVNEETVSE